MIRPCCWCGDRASVGVTCGDDRAERFVDRNEKGCDFGYALAANSCEGVTGVDACTVTALCAISAFAASKPRLTPRSAVGLFGSGGCSGCPDRTDRPAYFRAATISCRPFLPSTRATLLQDEKMSTPKDCATVVYFCVRIFVGKRQNSVEFPTSDLHYPNRSHMFFTETKHQTSTICMPPIA